jgi:tetratricopeptide (TPR) repeat protein
MVTGSKPFVETGAWKRLYQDPRPPKKLSPDLPDHWNKTIVCCLERDPQYRFCSASAVGESLSGDAAIAPIPPRPYILRLKMAVRKGAWLILAFFVVIAALAIPVVRYFRQGAEIPPGTTVLVTDIATDDPALAGITVALKSQLAQSAHFEIEEATKIVDTLKQMDRKPGDPLDAKTAREVAWRSGVPLVVFGSLTSARDGYLLSMAVERVKHSPLFPTLAWKRDFLAQDKTGLLNVVHDASSWVRMLAGEATRDMAQQDRPVEDTTTSSWQALQLYTAAEYKYSAGDIDAALLILREAIQADPDFAKAHMRLADILISKKNYKEGYAEWRTAFSLTDKRQLTSREALRLKGLYYADNGYYNEAESTFRQFTIHYPYDDLAWFYLGNSLEELGRTDDSIAAFTQAATLRLTSPYPHIHLALLHFATRDSKSASAEIQNVKHLGQIRWVNWLTAYAAFFDERYDQAVEQASVLLDSSTAAEKSDGYSIKATYLAELGHRREAISLLLEGSDFDRNHGLANDEAGKEIGLAYLYYREGEISQSRTRAMHAVNLDDSPQRLLEAGTLLALSRDLPSSQFCLERLKVQPSTPRVQAAINRLQGEIELAKNNFRSALAYFTKATSKARPIDTREFLARGLAVAGRNNEAAMVLQSLADAPARVLLDRGNDWPGLWGDTLFKLSTVKAKDGDVPCQYAQRYLRLRDNAGNKLDGEVIAVRRLFEQYCNSQPN